MTLVINELGHESQYLNHISRHAFEVGRSRGTVDEHGPGEVVQSLTPCKDIEEAGRETRKEMMNNLL